MTSTESKAFGPKFTQTPTYVTSFIAFTELYSDYAKSAFPLVAPLVFADPPIPRPAFTPAGSAVNRERIAREKAEFRAEENKFYHHQHTNMDVALKSAVTLHPDYTAEIDAPRDAYNLRAAIELYILCPPGIKSHVPRTLLEDIWDGWTKAPSEDMRTFIARTKAHLRLIIKAGRLGNANYDQLMALDPQNNMRAFRKFIGVVNFHELDLWASTAQLDTQTLEHAYRKAQSISDFSELQRDERAKRARIPDLEREREKTRRNMAMLAAKVDRVENPNVKTGAGGNGFGSRGPPVCRDFLAGRCLRGTSCPRIHQTVDQAKQAKIDDLKRQIIEAGGTAGAASAAPTCSHCAKIPALVDAGLTRHERKTCAAAFLAGTPEGS